MLEYKMDVLQELKDRGYTTYQIRKQGLFSQSTLQKMRDGKATLSWDNIDTICKLLNCQPGDILRYVPDE